ncbi:unnamed protein product [Phaedon cochleariae]|uniref:Uncharacterized protein n=1 Tax=Phaedon cochleariae TaxID=80249 RepID=A0A9N9X356_PHACE|nr:unnamed protein product [Phaedon cochleariae]
MAARSQRGQSQATSDPAIVASVKEVLRSTEFSQILSAIVKDAAKQAATGDPAFGIDCMATGNMNMRDQHVIESLRSKRQQLLLATQLVKMILKIDDVRQPN